MQSSWQILTKHFNLILLPYLFKKRRDLRLNKERIMLTQEPIREERTLTYQVFSTVITRRCSSKPSLQFWKTEKNN